MASRTKTAVAERLFRYESSVRLARRLHCVLRLRWRPEALMSAHVTRRANQPTLVQIAAHVGRYRPLGSICPTVLQGRQCLLFSQWRVAAQTTI